MKKKWKKGMPIILLRKTSIGTWWSNSGVKRVNAIVIWNLGEWNYWKNKIVITWNHLERWWKLKNWRSLKRSGIIKERALGIVSWESTKCWSKRRVTINIWTPTQYA